MKTSAKHFGLAVGNMNQNEPKTTSLMTSVTKNPNPQQKNIFSSVIY